MLLDISAESSQLTSFSLSDDGTMQSILLLSKENINKCCCYVCQYLWHVVVKTLQKPSAVNNMMFAAV